MLLIVQIIKETVEDALREASATEKKAAEVGGVVLFQNLYNIFFQLSSQEIIVNEETLFDRACSFKGCEWFGKL